MYFTKNKGKTEKGVRYIILQDGNRSFHVTASFEDQSIYEHFSVDSVEELRKSVDALCDEVYEMHKQSYLTNHSSSITLVPVENKSLTQDVEVLHSPTERG